MTAGCGERLDTSYGRTRGTSINGTGALAELFRLRGDEVRTAVRFTPELADWADTLVRFSPAPGPPALDEIQWYSLWLEAVADRRLIYVIRDFDAEPEYWAEIYENLPAQTPDARRERIRRRVEAARNGDRTARVGAGEPAPSTGWFSAEPSDSRTTGKQLGGPWSEGIDGKAAAVSRPGTITVDPGRNAAILLDVDGAPAALTWEYPNGSEVLILANGSFLLNEPLVWPERRKLAARVLDWAGVDELNVAFVEGVSPAREDATESRGAFYLLTVDPIGWIAGHLLALALIGGLYRATTLGRPRTPLDPDVQRPAAHAEALGAMLARTEHPGDAKALLETYHRWRRHSAQGRSERA